MVRIYRTHNNRPLLLLDFLFPIDIFAYFIQASFKLASHANEGFSACQFQNEVLVYCQVRNPYQHILSVKVDSEIASFQEF